MPAHTPDAPTQPHDNPDLIPVIAVTEADPRHPLDPLTAGEIEAAREILVSAGLLGDTVRVPMLRPDEVHEEDYGILWKDTEQGPVGSHVRRSRRLVVSYFSTIGNYDYGFYWYFSLDGSIQLVLPQQNGSLPTPVAPLSTSPRGRPESSKIIASFECLFYCGLMSETPPPPESEEGTWVLGAEEEFVPPVPDAVDLVVETATMMSVFAAQRLTRIDLMRRELLREADGRGDGGRDIVERSIRLELAAAMRVTEYAAGRLIAQAEALVRRYPAALEALGSGRLTEKHGEIIADLLDEAPPELREMLLQRAVPLAESEPVGTFRRALRTLIDTANATTLEERHQRALRARRIVVEPGRDGMAGLWIFAPEVEIHAIHGRLTQMAKAIARVEGETRTLDQLRADVATDLLIDGTTDHLPAAASGIRAQVVVTVPALSLLDDGYAEAGDPPAVEGVGPIPLSKARELCGGDARWMRVLTHPETGIVLSVGRDSYPPPAPLKRLVRWRADRCMGPGCSMPASRCEIDHQIRWADGGETCLDNTLPFCKGHHLVKDNTDWQVRQIEGSGGAVAWTSPTGRRYVVQPERKVPTFTVRPPARSDLDDGLGAEAPF